MTPERVQAIIASYGADDARWPAQERAAALVAVGHDAALMQSLVAARALDAALELADSAALADADAAAPEDTDRAALDDVAAARLARAIVAAVAAADAAHLPPPAPRADSRARAASLLRPALAAAATLLLGFSLGFSGMFAATGGDDDDALATEVGMAAFTTATSAETLLNAAGALHQTPGQR